MIWFSLIQKKISDDELKSIEQRLRIKLPPDFILFYKRNNGGEPNKTIFKDNNGTVGHVNIRAFIPILYAKRFGDDPDFTLNGRAEDEWSKLKIPKYLLPFSMSWIGDYVCLNLDNNKIYYYYRREWDDGLSIDANFEKNSKLIATSFSHFIENLEFYDEGSNSKSISKHISKKTIHSLFVDNSDKKLSNNDFKLIEKKLNLRLPSDLVEFYKKNNGGRPNKTIYYDCYEVLDFIEVRNFIPFLDATQFNGNPDFTADGIAKKEWQEFSLPKNFLLFAMDWGGNYICINLDDGRVFYYVKDVWSKNISTSKNFEVNSTPISPSFSYFIEHLELPEKEED